MRNLKLFPFIFLLPAVLSAQGAPMPETLSGRFAQTREIKQAGVTLRSEGRFSIDKNKGIKWVTEKPLASTVTLSPGSAPVGGEAGRQVAAIMQGLLVQDRDALSKYFDVAHSKTKNGYETRLKATDATIAKVFSEIVITGDKYIRTVALSNLQGDATLIKFTDIRESAGDFPEDGQR